MTSTTRRFVVPRSRPGSVLSRNRFEAGVQHGRKSGKHHRRKPQADPEELIMALSRRGKATLFSVLVFSAALVIYFASRPEARLSVSAPAGVDNAEEISRGRALGRRLAGMLSNPPAPSVPSAPPTHAQGPVCDKCTTENCVPGDDGCDSISDANDRRLCEELYACFSDPRNNCVIQGDPLRCWCGTNMTTCVTDNSGPTQANGPCVRQVFAAAKTSDADTIFRQFLNADLPLGRAARVTSCRGSFCSSDCKVP
jgi:hypothetical protein